MHVKACISNKESDVWLSDSSQRNLGLIAVLKDILNSDIIIRYRSKLW